MKHLMPVLILILLTATTAFSASESQVVKEETLRGVVSDFIKQRTDGLGMEIVIKRIVTAGDLNVPAGPVAYDVLAPARWEGWGSASLAVVVRVDGKVVKNLPVHVDVASYADMVVATRSLDRGEVLREGDVTLQRRELSTSIGPVVNRLDQAIGMQVRSAMRPNTPIRTDAIAKVPLIKSGQLVTVVAEQGTLRITTTGKAKSSGGAGDMITVQNLSSLKDVSAMVVDAGTVAVMF